jgi:hypothetical protein
MRNPAKLSTEGGILFNLREQNHLGFKSFCLFQKLRAIQENGFTKLITPPALVK